MRLYCANCGVVRFCMILRSVLLPTGKTVRAFQCGECNRSVLTGNDA